MSKVFKIIVLVALIFLEVVIVSLMYNKWFDTLDMIKTNPNFSAENYYNRTSKIWEKIIFYGSILMFVILDYFYFKKVLFTNRKIN